MSGCPNSAGFTDVRGSGNKTWGSRQPIKATKKSRDSRLQVPTCQWMLFLLLKSSAGPQEGSSTVLRQPSGPNSVTGFQCAACGEQMAPRLRQLQMCPPSWVSESSFTQSCALTAFPSSRLSVCACLCVYRCEGGHGQEPPVSGSPAIQSSGPGDCKEVYLSIGHDGANEFSRADKGSGTTPLPSPPAEYYCVISKTSKHLEVRRQPLGVTPHLSTSLETESLCQCVYQTTWPACF